MTGDTQDEEQVLVPKRRLEQLEARVATLEAFVTGGGTPQARDLIAEQFGAFVGRVKEYERRGRR
jgi:hypothetical protein